MRPLADPPQVGTVLRRFRAASGLSQEALSSRAGLHRTYIGQLERGERQPTVVALTRLLDILGVNWRDFGQALDESRGQIPS
jgi:transcriptional regulator with XRE-family HTH domain